MTKLSGGGGLSRLWAWQGLLTNPWGAISSQTAGFPFAESPSLSDTAALTKPFFQSLFVFFHGHSLLSACSLVEWRAHILLHIPTSSGQHLVLIVITYLDNGRLSLCVAMQQFLSSFTQSTTASMP